MGTPMDRLETFFRKTDPFWAKMSKRQMVMNAWSFRSNAMIESVTIGFDTRIKARLNFKER